MIAAILIRGIAWFADIITGAMFAQAILSWFVRDYTSPLAKIYAFLTQLTSPIVQPVRRFMSRIYNGPVDFSLWIAMLLVEFVANMLIRLIALIL